MEASFFIGSVVIRFFTMQMMSAVNIIVGW